MQRSDRSAQFANGRFNGARNWRARCVGFDKVMRATAKRQTSADGASRVPSVRGFAALNCYRAAVIVRICSGGSASRAMMMESAMPPAARAPEALKLVQPVAAAALSAGRREFSSSNPPVRNAGAQVKSWQIPAVIATERAA